MSNNRKEQVEREIRADLDRLQDDFQTNHPGLTELMTVYGEHEASLREAEQYASVLNPIVDFTITSGT